MSFSFTLLLFVLIGRKVKENFANYFLLSLLGMVAIGTLYVISLNYLVLPRFINYFINSLPALFGCLIYLYVRYSIYSINQFRLSNLLHFLPVVVAIPLGYFDSKELTFAGIFLEIGLKIVVSIVYILLTLRMLRNQKKITLNHFSNTDKTDLKWLVFIVRIGLISYFIYLVIMLLWALNFQIADNLGFYSNFIVLIFIFPICYYGLTATMVFVRISNLNAEQIVKPIINETPERNKSEIKELISHEKAEQIYQQLLLLINTKKLYLNENLTIEDLAREIDLHSKYISFVINSQSGKNFFDFINQFRVKEFNNMVLQPKNKHLSFLAMAFDCGFGSKSSFNRAYKNEMGISPTQFLKENQISVHNSTI